MLTISDGNERVAHRRLREKNRILERRLSDALGQEVAAELAAKGIVVGDTKLVRQVGLLQCPVGELEAELRRRDDDGDAVRQASLELMQKSTEVGDFYVANIARRGFWQCH